MLPPSSGIGLVIWSSYKEGGHETQGRGLKRELSMSQCEGMDKKKALIGDGVTGFFN
jgi:hypothetical protein